MVSTINKNNKHFSLSIFWVFLCGTILLLCSVLGGQVALADSPTTGCYQQVNNANESGYESLSNTCNGQAAYPSGTANPATNCYILSTAEDGSKVWVLGCGAVNNSNLLNANVTTPTSGCYEYINNSQQTGYDQLDNSACAGAQVSPSGKADPTTNCYLEGTQALDGSVLWTEGCSGITSTQILNAGTVNANGTSPTGNATSGTGATTPVVFSNDAGTHQCGSGSGAIKTTIDFGCTGESCIGLKSTTTATTPPTSTSDYCSADHSGLIDLIFAIIRFLSVGVGIVVIASIVVGGIQYTTSRGDPNATAKATERIRSALIALLIFIFAYAILNYVIPVGFFKQ